jgi:hypothetical protein
MSAKNITDNLLTTISKGPLFVFVVLGFGIWQASKMSEAQLITLNRLVEIFNNTVGLSLLFVFVMFFVYAFILYPSGKFVANFSREFIEMQKEHNRQHDQHVEASKGMFHMIDAIKDECQEMHEKLNKFYGHD